RSSSGSFFQILCIIFCGTGLSVREWAASSPDLNPIKHLWDQFVCAVEEWDAIRQQSVTELLTDVRRRYQAVMDLSGFPTILTYLTFTNIAPYCLYAKDHEILLIIMVI
uniref:Uncharacterized protein n=1 Tax=Oryzias melastigma TaxID=30732 RepID=A0A3B3CK80_ORYME